MKKPAFHEAVQWACILIGVGVGFPPGLSQTEDNDTLTQIARETSDPTSDIWFLNAQFALSTRPERAFQNSNAFTLELQPSLPFTLGSRWRILNFPDLVLATIGTSQGRQISGLESFSWLAAISPPAQRLGFSWAAGPFLEFPVATSSVLGSALWQVGAGGVLAWRSENFLASAVVKSAWTTSGNSSEVGSLQIQYNLQYFLGGGWQVGLGRPRIEYTWDRDGGGWDVPVGVDFGWVFHVGKLPVKVLWEYEFFALNDSRWEPEHLFRISFIPVFPSPFNRMPPRQE